MKGYYEYIVLYESSIIADIERSVKCDPVNIKVFSGLRDFFVTDSHQVVPVGTGRNIPILNVRKISLEEKKKYILLKVLTKESGIEDKEKFCEDKVDTIIAILSIRYGADIFSNLIYRGWLWKELQGAGKLESWIKLMPLVSMSNSSNILNENMTALHGLPSDMKKNFILMSRFFSKAINYVPSEEKFVLLWTILEIFPMNGKNKYRLISNYLATALNKNVEIIANFLGIKELHQIRNSLVHAGNFPVDLAEKSDLFDKLENIIYVVMQHMLGISYDNRLDKYFTNPKYVDKYFLKNIGIAEQNIIDIKNNLSENTDLLRKSNMNYNMIVPYFKNMGLEPDKASYILAFLYFRYYGIFKQFIENIRANTDCHEDLKLLVDEIKINKER